MRRAAAVDANHTAVVAALRAVGAAVTSLAAVGDGCPDLVVGRAGETFLLEVKDGAKEPARRRLTPAEKAWHERWRGRPVAVVENVEEALTAIGARVAKKSAPGRILAPPSLKGSTHPKE